MQISRQSDNRIQIDAVLQFRRLHDRRKRIVLKTRHFWQGFQIDPVSSTVSIGGDDKTRSPTPWSTLWST